MPSLQWLNNITVLDFRAEHNGEHDTEPRYAGEVEEGTERAEPATGTDRCTLPLLLLVWS